MNDNIGRGQAALAGVLGAAFALAVGWWLAALAGEPSPVGNVAAVVIDRAPKFVVELAIDLFSTNDKLALGVGVVIITLFAGAAVGRSARRNRWVTWVAYLAFVVVGALAAFDRPDANNTVAVLILMGVAAAGIAVQSMLLAVQRNTHAPFLYDALIFDRRWFLGLAGGVAVATIGTAAWARAIVNQVAVKARSAVRLPRPTRPAAVIPADASLAVPGITPIVTSNADFYRIDTAFVTPRIDPSEWALSLSGLVEQPITIDYDALLDMPMVERYVTLACVSNEVGGNLIGNAKWLGVPLRDLLDRARPMSEAEQVVGRSADGWTAGFPIGLAADGREALVAVGMNDEPLPFDHGFPARLVVEGVYGYVSATKWLTEITLTRWDDFDGYWIPRGWSKEGPIKTQSRIDVPRGGSLPAGRTVVAGVAWAQNVGIARVEVRVDGGSWKKAELAAAISDSTWRQWKADVDLTPGDHVIEVRASDSMGKTQTEDRAAPAPNGATGYHQRRISVR